MFPFTRHSVIASAASSDADVRRAGFDRLAGAYWKPVYKYVRLRWGVAPEEAEDLTQGFFARAFEKRYFDTFDPGRARFRTFLRTCLDGFVANERQSRQRFKRGGGAAIVPLDVLAAEGELRRQADAAVSLDEYLDREWTRGVLALAVDRLRAEAARTGRTKQLAVFTRYDLEAPDRAERLTYADVAREMNARRRRTDLRPAVRGDDVCPFPRRDSSRPEGRKRDARRLRRGARPRLGIARAEEPEGPGLVIGTPGSMAPEQAAGLSGAADPRTDVFGLGGILAAMAGVAAPPPLAAIAARARSVDPAARYPTVDDMAKDVRAFAEGRPVSAMMIGAVLGALDGMTSYVSEPEVRPVILQIVAGSTVKGVITGILIALFERKVKSLALGILPGGLVGVLVGYATYRHSAPGRLDA
jgi:hypothetical protein